MTSQKSLSGFQGSETTSVEVTAYHRGDDPITVWTGASQNTFTGRSAGDADASIIGVQTSKALGSSSGSFTVQLKPSELSAIGAHRWLEDHLTDDDWIDITFLRHGVPYHTMRGLIEGIEMADGPSGQGPTTRAYTLTGRDFGCIFDKTKVWFNRVVGELAEFAAIKIFEGRSAIGNPAELVKKVLYGFMGALEDVNRANWLLPPDMPGAVDTFARTVLFADSFANDPERQGVSLQLLQPNGEGIWQLAQEYSDPMFTEMFCDLISDTLVTGTVDHLTGSSTPGDTKMAVIFRDKPFINHAAGKNSPWFNLPLVEVPRTHVGQKRVSRSTQDRYNAFFVAPQVYQEGGFTKDIMGPLWDEADVRKHGMRSFDVESRYTASESNLFNLVRPQRERVRDWHCLGPYFWSGTIPLQRLYPDIRVGTRLRVIGASAEFQEDYYVEGVDQSWALRAGGKTRLSVTRGWIGGDDSQLRALATMVARYAEVVQ